MTTAEYAIVLRLWRRSSPLVSCGWRSWWLLERVAHRFLLRTRSTREMLWRLVAGCLSLIEWLEMWGWTDLLGTLIDFSKTCTIIIK